MAYNDDIFRRKPRNGPPRSIMSTSRKTLRWGARPLLRRWLRLNMRGARARHPKRINNQSCAASISLH